MKTKDLRKKNTKELADALAETTELVHTVRLGIKKHQTKNVRALRTAKKDIARIKTLLREAEMKQ
ncbi:MAG: 50S ribosomal protein L29 [Patescibacteria group bacterium]|nr:50S ribosomal protein L29 [Patescibacteria group bacterium]MDE1945827.1 50S ribosomal protein L29 [Patescibacteria group bacterium]